MAQPALDVDHDAHGALDPAELDHARRGVPVLADEAVWIPPDPPAPPRGRGRGVLFRGAPSAARSNWRRRGRPPAGGARRLAVLRHTPAARGVRRLGHGAARRPLRGLVPLQHPDVPRGGSRRPRPSAVVAGGLPGVLRPGGNLKGDRHDAACGADPPGRLSAAADRGPMARLDGPRGATGLAGEDPVSASGSRRGGGGGLRPALTRRAARRAALRESDRGGVLRPLLLSVENIHPLPDLASVPDVPPRGPTGLSDGRERRDGCGPHRRPALATAEVAGGARSEEHTSEL